jgi:hypothetical protein
LPSAAQGSAASCARAIDVPALNKSAINTGLAARPSLEGDKKNAIIGTPDSLDLCSYQSAACRIN